MADSRFPGGGGWVIAYYFAYFLPGNLKKNYTDSWCEGCDPPLQRDASFEPTPESATVTDLGDHPLGFMHVCVGGGRGGARRGGAEGSYRKFGYENLRIPFLGRTPCPLLAHLRNSKSTTVNYIKLRCLQIHTRISTE